MSLLDPLTPEMRVVIDAAADQVLADVLRAPKVRRPLTDKEQAVVERRALGETEAQVAAALGISRSAVARRMDSARRNGHAIPKRNPNPEPAAAKTLDRAWTDDRLATLTRLYRDGQSASQIAPQIGPDFTGNMVAGKVDSLKLPKHSKAATRQHAALASRRYAKEVRGTPAKAKAKPAPAPKVDGPDLVITPARVGAFEALRGSTPRPWIEHQPGMCRWPIDNEEGFPAFACCERTPFGENYCGSHARLAFSPRVKKPASDNRPKFDFRARHRRAA